MKYFQDIVIDKDIVSVFGSGNSVNDLTEKELNTIYEKTFVFSLNYAPIKLQSHVNMWSDKAVTDWVYNHYKGRKKDRLFLSREEAFNNPRRGMNSHESMHSLVDYFFKTKELIGNYTIVWLLELLEKYFPDKKVLVFGMDMYAENSKRAKFYDDYTDFDLRKRGEKYPVQRKLDECGKQLDKNLKNKKMFINCNPKSGYKGFEIKEWKEIIS